MGRNPGGKASRAHQLKLVQQKLERDAANDEDVSTTAGFHDDEPELAQPARKKARAEPSRKSTRGQPEKRKLTPRGPQTAKPRQKPAAEISPRSLEKRRKRDRGYAQAFRDRSKDEDDEAPLEPDPSYGKSGASKAAQKNKKHRVITKGRKWLESVGDEASQAQALKDVSELHDKRRAAKAAGYHASEEVETALYSQRQRKKMYQRATATAKVRAGVNDDQRSWVEANQVGEAASPGDGKKPTLAARARATGLPASTARRGLLAAEAKRAQLTAHAKGIAWSSVKARKGHSKITEAVRAALLVWVLNHSRVINSPIANETLLVKNEETGKMERVGKLLLEISVRELHNDLIELPPAEGGKGGGLAEARDSTSRKVIISDTALRYLLPPQLKPMTEKHKQMCGCETCLVPDSHQKTLNAWRSRHKREMTAKANAMPAGRAKTTALQQALNYQKTLNLNPPTPWHLKPGLALDEIQCQPVANGLPRWDCVMRCCDKCPAYPVPAEEKGTDENDPKIKFHVYQTVTECTKHGVIAPGSKVCVQCQADPSPPAKAPKVRSRKHLTLLERPIGVFHRDYYLPSLEKLAYHRPHCRILSKDHCGNARLAAFKRRPSVRTRRDYAERLAAAFNLEAQHEHFGNGRSLSMEGSSVETFCKAAAEAYAAGVWQMDEADLRMVFHSHFSDDSRQDAATTHAHMTVLFDELRSIGELMAGLTVWDDTDGCAKQYRCGTAIYLLSVLASAFDITIDRAIGAPGHGKDLVDGLNATDKMYLRKMMCMVGTPEANDSEKRMAAHSMLEGAKKSLAEECARLCSLPERSGGVKSEGGKRAKREGEAKMKERRYHVQDPAGIQFPNLKMSAVGFEAGEHNGIIAHYNVRVSKDLGVGKAAVRRVPCACDACLSQLDEPWKPGVEPENQPRFASSTKCIYWPNFKQGAGEPGLNDWKIISLCVRRIPARPA
jgi:hypothetical protein